MLSFNPGLNIVHDIKTEGYLVAHHSTTLGITPPTQPFVPIKKHWKTDWQGDQGQTPKCTGYGPIIALDATPIRHDNTKLPDPNVLYEMNREYDKSRGWIFDEGATVISAMESLKKLGFIKAYFAGYTMDELFRALARGPVVAGTMVTNSMFDRDAKGVARIDLTSGWAGGHCYTLSGYDPHTNLLKNPESWGDGDYYFDADEWYQLLRRDGEFWVMQEVKDAA